MPAIASMHPPIVLNSLNMNDYSRSVACNAFKAFFATLLEQREMTREKALGKGLSDAQFTANRPAYTPAPDTTRGERFKILRSKLGLTQKGLADLFKVSRNTWGRYEAGEYPSAEVLDRMANLHFSVDWLFTGRGEMSTSAGAVPDFDGINMRLSEELASAPGTDAELMALITDGLVNAYREEDARLPGIEIGRLAAPIYDRLRRLDDDAERRGALRYALDDLRDRLRQLPGEASGKRQA